MHRRQRWHLIICVSTPTPARYPPEPTGTRGCCRGICARTAILDGCCETQFGCRGQMQREGLGTEGRARWARWVRWAGGGSDAQRADSLRQGANRSRPPPETARDSQTINPPATHGRLERRPHAHTAAATCLAITLAAAPTAERPAATSEWPAPPAALHSTPARRRSPQPLPSVVPGGLRSN